MTTLFKIIFRNTARKLVANALETGIARGFQLGRAYEQSHVQNAGIVMGVNYQNQIESILEKSGF